MKIIEKSHAPISPGTMLMRNPLLMPILVINIVPKRPPLKAPVRLMNQVVQNIRKVNSRRICFMMSTGMKAQVMYEIISISSRIVFPIIGVIQLLLQMNIQFSIPEI